LGRGDEVKVAGVRGSFKFWYAEQDHEKVTSVCVLGGPANRSQFRHFMAERIVIKKKRRGVK
jgi:hypothetical protein